jgi:transposase
MKSTSSKSASTTPSSPANQPRREPKPLAKPARPDAFIGIDYHKRYSVYHVTDADGVELAKGRIEHACPEVFRDLVKRWKRPRVVFEATMNWHWLFEVLESVMPAEDIVLANPYKTRIIAEAQVKTDKVDARILTHLLRADLICKVHIASKPARERKEVLRQRCFFVKQRTMLRNRIHRLLGAQHGVPLPEVTDLFGKKGMEFLEALELPAPSGLLLRQQLEMLRGIALRIKEDEAALATMRASAPGLEYVGSVPGMGAILSAVVMSEIDDIERFPSAQKLTAYAGLCPSTSSSGGKTYNGKLLKQCNKWLRWAFVEAAWVAVGCDPYFKAFYKRKRALGKKGNVSMMCVARRMCRITWQLLTQRRCYAKVSPPENIQGRPAGGNQILPAGSTKEVKEQTLPAIKREASRKRRGVAAAD